MEVKISLPPSPFPWKIFMIFVAVAIFRYLWIVLLVFQRYFKWGSEMGEATAVIEVSVGSG